MSIDVLNETEFEVDELELVECSRFVLDQLRVHPRADLCIRLVDEATMTVLHEQWMDLPGPTDVMSFPMDELSPGARGRSRPRRVCSATSSCARASPPARPRGRARPEEELLLLTTHGILHLLGFDHAEPAEERRCSTSSAPSCSPSSPQRGRAGSDSWPVTRLVVLAVIAILLAFLLALAEAAVLARTSRVRAAELVDEGKAGAQGPHRSSATGGATCLRGCPSCACVAEIDGGRHGDLVVVSRGSTRPGRALR
jgi:probable rRNA maturation factor